MKLYNNNFTKALISVGQIWEVTTDNFFTSDENRQVKRPIKLHKGEKIEIRYPYAWHFRTEDNIYLHATEKMILDNCSHFGDVLEQIKSANKATLEEILRLGLFQKIDNKENQ